jgi:predicted GH43/DUF377 family glycosyl hydrolase
MQLIDLDFHDIFGYKYIFNPSITPKEDGTYLLICRLQDHAEEGYLGLCLLDKNLSPTGKGRIIRSSVVMEEAGKVMLEDPRIITDKGKVYLYHVESGTSFLYLSYTVFGILHEDGRLENQVVLAYRNNRKAWEKLASLGYRQKPALLSAKSWLIEKNWQFFIRQQNYYCIYRAGEKQEIFQFDFPGASIRKRFRTYARTGWEYGRISGGAPPVLHTDNCYYSFFHSWSKWDRPAQEHSWLQRKYHIGVYVFESTPPFRMKLISQRPLLSGSDTDAIAESGHSVVFPGSAFFDASTGEWVLAIGWNDHSCKAIRIPHREITEDLKPVGKLPLLSVLKMETAPFFRKLKTTGGNIYRRIKNGVTGNSFKLINR